MAPISVLKLRVIDEQIDHRDFTQDQRTIGPTYRPIILPLSRWGVLWYLRRRRFHLDHAPEAGYRVLRAQIYVDEQYDDRPFEQRLRRQVIFHLLPDGEMVDINKLKPKMQLFDPN